MGISRQAGMVAFMDAPKYHWTRVMAEGDPDVFCRQVNQSLFRMYGVWTTVRLLNMGFLMYGVWTTAK